MKFMPWVETVVTKKGMRRNCAASKHLAVVEEGINESITRTVETLYEKRAFVFQTPVKMELEYARTTAFIKFWIRRSGWRLSGMTKFKKTLSTMLEWQC